MGQAVAEEAGLLWACEKTRRTQDIGIGIGHTPDNMA